MHTLTGEVSVLEFDVSHENLLGGIGRRKYSQTITPGTSANRLTNPLHWIGWKPLWEVNFEMLADGAEMALPAQNIAVSTSSSKSHGCWYLLLWPLGTLVRTTFVGYRSDLLIIRSKEGVAGAGLFHTQSVSYAFSVDSCKPQKSQHASVWREKEVRWTFSLTYTSVLMMYLGGQTANESLERKRQRPSRCLWKDVVVGIFFFLLWPKSMKPFSKQTWKDGVPCTPSGLFSHRWAPCI